MSYFDSSESTLHCISEQKNLTLFNKAKKENALPSIKKKIVSFMW